LLIKLNPIEIDTTQIDVPVVSFENDSSTATQVFLNLSSFKKGYYRLYYAFYNFNKEIYFKGHGDIKRQ